MECESGFTRSMNDEVHSWNIQGEQMEGEAGVTRSIIDNFNLALSNEIKWRLKAWRYSKYQ